MNKTAAENVVLKQNIISKNAMKILMRYILFYACIGREVKKNN